MKWKLQLNIYHYIISGYVILHLRSRKDFAGKTKHRSWFQKKKNNKNLPSSPGVIYVIYRADVLGTESIHFIFIPKREIIGFLTERHNHTDVF